MQIGGISLPFFNFPRQNIEHATIHSRMNRTFVSLLTLLGMLHLALADSALRWDKKTVELQPSPGRLSFH